MTITTKAIKKNIIQVTNNKRPKEIIRVLNLKSLTERFILAFDSSLDSEKDNKKL